MLNAACASWLSLLEKKFLGEIIKFSKVELGLESTGIIYNGSKVTERWLDKYGKYLDIMGVSCDSFDVETNLKIERSEKWERGTHKEGLSGGGLVQGSKDHVQVEQLGDWKIRIIGSMDIQGFPSHHNEVLTSSSQVFQVLLDGENVGPNAIRDAQGHHEGTIQSFLKTPRGTGLSRGRRQRCDGEPIPP